MAYRILHIISGLSTGGAQRALLNLIDVSAAKEGEVAVISLRDEGTYGKIIRELDVPVFSLNVGAHFLTSRAVFSLRKLVNDFNPDVLQGWMYHGNVAASLVSFLADARPAVAWNVRHSLYSLREEKFLTRQAIRANRALSHRADAIVYNSHLSKQQHERFGFSSIAGGVIPNGFDLSLLEASVPTSNLSTRKELMIPETALVIGHVARYHPMKDHQSFLRAAVQLALEDHATCFIIIGNEVGPSNSTLLEIVPRHIRNRFHFLGEQKDVLKYMKAMDVFCCSSAWGEAFPNVLGEAMACGVPCVSTDVGDSALIIGDTGIIVPPKDTDALYQGLLRMVSMSAAERRDLGSVARKRIDNEYNLSKICEKYACLYESLLAAKL